jgi:DNA polymerase III psi subunit
VAREPEVLGGNILQQFLRSVRRLLVTANFPTSPILFSLMMKALSSSETSVLTRAILRNIPEDAILLMFVLHCIFDVVR